MHVFHAASFAFRPDLPLTKLIGKDWLLTRDVDEKLEKFVLSKFEEIQIYIYLYEGKSVSLFLHIL